MADLVVHLVGVRVSNYPPAAVWAHSKASGCELLVLLCLADRADRSGVCWPSVSDIAKRCRMSERSVHRHLRVLVELGEIAMRERHGQSSIYTVLLRSDTYDNLADPEPEVCQPVTPAKLARVPREVSQSVTSANLSPLPNRALTSANLSPTSATVGRQNSQELFETPQDLATARKPDLAATFEIWWKTYPNTAARRDAYKAYLKAAKAADVKDLQAGAEKAAIAWGVQPHRMYCPRASTFLNGERWIETPEQMNPKVRLDATADEIPWHQR